MLYTRPARTDFLRQRHQFFSLTPEFQVTKGCKQINFYQPVIQKEQGRKNSFETQVAICASQKRFLRANINIYKKKEDVSKLLPRHFISLVQKPIWKWFDSRTYWVQLKPLLPSS